MLLGTLKPDKQPAETFLTGIDFTAELDSGETIVVCTTTARSLSDGTDRTALFLSGVPQILGPTVKHRIQGGVIGETYRVQMRITTNATPQANVYEHEFDVPVSET